MTLVKNIFLVIIVSTATLKIADFSFGLFQQTEFLTTSVNRAADRSIVLREFNPNQSASVTRYGVTGSIPSADDKFMSRAESLEQGLLYNVKIDANGFIYNGNPYELNPELRIIFFGGSTTENLYVKTQNRFPSVVERYMRKELSQKVATHNSGVSGNNSMHSNLALIAKGIPLKPNFVILMHNVNDLALLSKSNSYWIAPIGRALVSGNSQSSFTAKASSNSAIFFLFKSVKNIIFPNLYRYLQPRLLPASRGDEFEGFRGKDSIDFEEAEKQFHSSLVSFVQVSRAWGIEPILMTQSNRMTIDDLAFKLLLETVPELGISPKKFVAIYKRFNNITRMVAKDKNVSLIDLDALIPGSAKYLYDGVHFNDDGSRLAGQIISDHLINMLSKD